MTDPQATPRLPQAWRYTAERAVAFFSVLCLNWHDGNVCTRPAGHKGKHRHSLKVAWTVVPPLTEARQIASDLRLSQEEGRRAAAILAGAAACEALAEDARSDGPLSRRAIYHYFQEAGAAGIEGVLLALASYLGKFAGPAPAEAWNQRLDAAATLMHAYFETPEEAVRPVPLVTGDDVMHALGVPAGPVLGQLLKAVYEAQAAGEVADRAAAMAFLRRALDQG